MQEGLADQAGLRPVSQSRPMGTTEGLTIQNESSMATSISRTAKGPLFEVQRTCETGDETNDPKEGRLRLLQARCIDGSCANPDQQAAADLALIQDLFRLDQKNQLKDPEASLYAGLATVVFSALLLEDNPDDPFLALNLPYLDNALENIITGLAGLQPAELTVAMTWLTGPFGNTAPGVVDILADADFGEPIKSILDVADAYLDGLNSGLHQVALVQSSYAFA